MEEIRRENWRDPRTGTEYVITYHPGEYGEVAEYEPVSIPEGADCVFVRKCREFVNGMMQNATYLRGVKANWTSTVYDPVRTPEQQAKRDKDIREAIAVFGREMLNLMGEDWFREHLQVNG